MDDQQLADELREIADSLESDNNDPEHGGHQLVESFDMNDAPNDGSSHGEYVYSVPSIVEPTTNPTAVSGCVDGDCYVRVYRHCGYLVPADTEDN